MTGLTPSEILGKVREVLDRDHVKDGMFELWEEGKGNKCPPIKVSHRGKFWALRVRDLRVLQR